MGAIAKDVLDGIRQVRPINTPEWVADLFHAVDAWDVEGFMNILTEEVHFQFGSSDATQGIENVRSEVNGWITGEYSMQHTLSATIIQGDMAVVHGTVTYTLLDSSKISIPSADIWTMEGAQVKE